MIWDPLLTIIYSLELIQHDMGPALTITYALELIQHDMGPALNYNL